MRIGLDFDNTIINYDEVFRQAAEQRGLIQPGFVGTKQQVRDTIRCAPEGESSWQALQGYVYGKGITDAILFPGVADFLRRALTLGDTVFVVSHKTEFGHFDPDKVNLRHAAMRWMEKQGLFSERGLALVPSQVHFASSRSDKLSIIRKLDCDVFVDDLEEVLTDVEFPARVLRILFSDTAEETNHLALHICRDWRAIAEVIFLGRN